MAFSSDKAMNIINLNNIIYSNNKYILETKLLGHTYYINKIRRNELISVLNDKIMKKRDFKNNNIHA